MDRLQERNTAILDDRMSGKTLRFIAEKHHIGVPRVRQILNVFCRKALESDILQEKVSQLQAENLVLKSKVRAYKKNAGEVNDEGLVEYLEISLRAHNALKNAGVVTVAQLKNMTDAELLSIPNIGRKTLHEIKSLIFA